MKQLLMVGLFVLAAPALAKDVHEIRDVRAKSEIRVINVAGDIRVEAWSKNQVEVDADLGSGVEELVFEVDGNDVLIKVKAPKHHSRNISSDLMIKVPEKSSLEVSAVSADVIVEGVRGRLSLGSVSGDIRSTAFESDIEMESVSGDIEVQGDDKKIRISIATVSGDIDLKGMDGEVETGTVSGDILLVESKYETVEAQTVNGDIIFHAALYGDSRMDMETVNGEVDVKFSGDVSARFDIETFNGRIRNCFGPKAKRTGKYVPGRELKFTEGGGKGRVVIQTLNGEVNLCRD